MEAANTAALNHTRLHNREPLDLCESFIVGSFCCLILQRHSPDKLSKAASADLLVTFGE
jgi:hypothetical protein